MKRLLLSCVLFGVPVAANAADLPSTPSVDVVAPAPVLTWTGVYLGAHAGYGWADVEWTHIDDIPAGSVEFDDLSPGDEVSHELDGWLAGGQIGANYQIGHFVLGVELSGSATDLEDESLSTEGSEDDVNTTEINSIFAATGRLGFAWDRFHLYGKGGYATGEVETEIFDDEGDAGFTETSEWHHGYTLGVGAEVMLTPRFVAGLEYAFTDLGEEEHVSTGFDDGVATGELATDVDVENIHSVALRLNVLFGAGLR